MSATNHPVKKGDRINVGFVIGPNEYWHNGDFEVKHVGSNGVPYVRHRYGKVDKPAQIWRRPIFKPSGKL